jgi:protein TonB
MRTALATVAATVMLIGRAPPRHPDTQIECKVAVPKYSVVSRRFKEAGAVDVRAMINRDGQITNVTVAKSSGYERLDAAAIAAMRASVCEPLYRGGERVSFSLTQPFRFGLSD